MMTKSKKLPNKLSELILIALGDLRKAERSAKYKVTMHAWHQPNSKCKVCFAGSVMAFSLGCNPKENKLPSNFDADTTRKLLALDNARAGEFQYAIEDLGLSSTTAISASRATEDIDVPLYHTKNRLAFYTAMRKAAKALKKIGL